MTRLTVRDFRSLFEKIFCFFTIVILLLACGNSSVTKSMLNAADSLLYHNPDSAYQLLSDFTTQYDTWDRTQQMRFQLLYHDAQNKTNRLLTSDSLMQVVADYYDGWGHSSNERMRARYLLGCVYRDMGETPRAIDCYLDAIEKADTTGLDCDYRTLSCVYSQMAWLFKQQLLPTYEIEARRKSIQYAIMAKDTLNAIYEQDMSAGAYIMLNKRDSAEMILKSVATLYHNYKAFQDELDAIEQLIYLYVDRQEKLSEAKLLMDKFEAEAECFDEHHEIHPSRCQYYYYKGVYFESINNLDSAEFYYRKVERPNMDYISKDPMYRGLLSVFTKRQKPDSIAKYASLFCMVNDSSIAVSDRELTARLAAIYQYNSVQKEISKNKEKVKVRNFGLLVLGGMFIVGLYAALRLWRKHKWLRKIDTARQGVLGLLEEELHGSNGQNKLYREKYLYVVKEISELKGENARLLEEIERLKKQDVVSGWIEKSRKFSDTTIFRRFRDVINSPGKQPSDAEWESLTASFGNHFPVLYHDLSLHPDKNGSLRERICILTVMGIRNAEQSNILGVTKQTISNNTSALNRILFGDSSARTFPANLKERYHICL